MQVCVCCGVPCGGCLADEGLLEEATRFRRALERIESWRDEDPSKVFSINTARSLARTALGMKPDA